MPRSLRYEVRLIEVRPKRKDSQPKQRLTHEEAETPELAAKLAELVAGPEWRAAAVGRTILGRCTTCSRFVYEGEQGPQGPGIQCGECR